MKENKTKARRKSERKVELATCIPLPFLHMHVSLSQLRFWKWKWKWKTRLLSDPTQNPKSKNQRRKWVIHTHWF